MKIYLDDIRNPEFTYPEGTSPLYGNWVIARNYDEFEVLIKNLLETDNSLPSVISFDHDLGEDSLSGYDALKWLVELSLDKDLPLENVLLRVHSANPVGSDNLRGLIKNFQEFKKSSH